MDLSRRLVPAIHNFANRPPSHLYLRPQGRFGVRCPLFSTGCPGMLQDSEIRQCLPGKEWQRFERLRCAQSDCADEQVCGHTDQPKYRLSLTNLNLNSINPRVAITHCRTSLRPPVASPGHLFSTSYGSLFAVWTTFFYRAGPPEILG